MSRPPPSADAIRVDDEMPPPHVEVLAWISDTSVAIEHYPVVAWRAYSEAEGWWTGTPGHYVHLRDARWAVTHWRRLEPEKATTNAE